MRDAFIQRFASPASLVADDTLRQKHQAALSEMSDRHLTALQPVLEIVHFKKTLTNDRSFQNEVKALKPYSRSRQILSSLW